MKIKKFLIGTIVAIAILKTGFYVNPVKVISNDNGMVYVQDYTGNIWSYVGAPEMIGTKHIYVMFTRFNNNIRDDVIICKMINRNNNYVYTPLQQRITGEDILFAEYMTAIERGYRE